MIARPTVSVALRCADIGVEQLPIVFLKMPKLPPNLPKPKKADVQHTVEFSSAGQ
jgi:hypothetical protein